MPTSTDFFKNQKCGKNVLLKKKIMIHPDYIVLYRIIFHDFEFVAQTHVNTYTINDLKK